MLLEKAGVSHVETLCPKCGWRLNASACPTDDRRPEGGDFSLCGKCYVVLRFESDLRLKAVSEAELEALDEDILEDLQKVRTILISLARRDAGGERGSA